MLKDECDNCQCAVHNEDLTLCETCGKVVCLSCLYKKCSQYIEDAPLNKKCKVCAKKGFGIMEKLWSNCNIFML